jgi:hypothetical protein
MQQLESSLTKPYSGFLPREPRVKVEEQEKTADLSLLEMNVGSSEDEEDVVDDSPTTPLSALAPPKFGPQASASSNHTEVSIDDEIVGDLPTEPLVASLPEIMPVKNSSPSSSTANGNVKRFDDMEKMLTHPLEAQKTGILPPPVNHTQQHGQAPVEPILSPVLPRPLTLVPLHQSAFSPAQELRQTPPVSMPVLPTAHAVSKSRKPLVLVFVLLFMLLLGGFIAWDILFQPFAVPDITKTTQSLQNSHLGMSLQYPQRWMAEVHEQNGTIYLYDDNHTDQVNIAVVATGGQSIDYYISKVEGSLGMTGQKTEPSLSFAGTSWHQAQGNVQQSGATYLATLLVTLHGGRYYSVVQLAPASTYIHEDQLVFSAIRSSIQFL